jgi:hypothetical protein
MELYSPPFEAAVQTSTGVMYRTTCVPVGRVRSPLIVKRSTFVR